MKKLTDDLKRMLAGLANQDAGEFLPMDDKMRFIGEQAQPPTQAGVQAGAAPPHAAPVRRIAVIINKGSTEDAFSHALQACQRLGARLDLLLTGPAGRERVAQLKAALQRAGVEFQSVYLTGPVARGIADYAERSLSLVYLVAAVDDPDVAELVEDTLPARRRTLPVPLVLIGDKPSRQVAAARAV